MFFDSTIQQEESVRTNRKKIVCCACFQLSASSCVAIT